MEENKALSDEFWRNLSNEQIGFFTSMTADNIPESPGIYGWFLPLKLNTSPEKLNTSPEDLLSLSRRIFAYDSQTKSVGHRVIQTGFKWDPLILELRRDVKEPKNGRGYRKREKQWKQLLHSGDDAIETLRKVMLIGSLFSAPLYIGLTKSLRRRYSEHTSDHGEGDENTFPNRFSKFIDESIAAKHIETRLRVDNLLFVSIPLRHDNGFELGTVADLQIKMAEELLKNICSPVFGDR